MARANPKAVEQDLRHSLKLALRHYIGKPLSVKRRKEMTAIIRTTIVQYLNEFGAKPIVEDDGSDSQTLRLKIQIPDRFAIDQP